MRETREKKTGRKGDEEVRGGVLGVNQFQTSFSPLLPVNLFS
jgi:hypothetical protein